MSHLIDTMAYTGQTPWHGLGAMLPPQQSVDRWIEAAGMAWRIEESDVLFNVDAPALHLRPFSDSKVLYRSDTLEPLSVVSQRYHVVQPEDVLHFYRDLVSVGGFTLETAGSLKGGRKLWALAKTGQSLRLKGGDHVNSYLLLATSCDGTLCTTAQFTSVRVVCNNTLQMAVNQSSGAIKVPHSTQFDPAAVKQALGLGLSRWDEFKRQLKALSARPVDSQESQLFFSMVLDQPLNADNNIIMTTTLQRLQALYQGQGMGADLASSQNTAWGLVNAVTEFVDHHRRARSQDNRLDSAWFGLGAQMKTRAMQHALALLN